jgi:hypothetical protein
MKNRRNITCFIQWLKSMPNTDTGEDGLKAKIKDNLSRNNVSKKIK